MSTLAWQKVRIPPVERIVLADIALRRGKSEEEVLVELIRREAAKDASSWNATPAGGTR